MEQTLAAGVFGAVHRTGNSNALYKADQAFLSHGAQSCYVCRFDRAGCSGPSHCLWPRGTTPRDQWLSDSADRIRGFIGWNALTWRLDLNQISRLDSKRVQVAVPDATVGQSERRESGQGHHDRTERPEMLVAGNKVGARVNAVRLAPAELQPFLPRLDLVEFRTRSFKFGIEEPHRIKNFAEGCRCSCSVSLSKGEDAIVSQISHDPRV